MGYLIAPIHRDNTGKSLPAWKVFAKKLGLFTKPQRCPNPACPHHTDGAKGFYVRKGTSRTKHDHQLVPRYRCKECGRWFNSRSFSPTAGQHKTEVNREIMELICSGVTLRRTARIARVAKKTVERKVRWLAKEAHKAHARFLASPPERTSYVQVDEMETYEQSKLKPSPSPWLCATRRVRSSTPGLPR